MKHEWRPAALVAAGLGLGAMGGFLVGLLRDRGTLKDAGFSKSCMVTKARA
ncbi:MULTISPECIES: hypothetical protein [Streptomycetaceae]|uniref:hypothetical protein n=1 Tax=Streptomycetaceae TaxID=2062 RepID=UPI0012FF83D9|nr:MULTISPECIES: hypothetical protein [Streptomycetaceae]MYS60052.1 hypothetical protein [Streptomyces sp. SID5468]